MDRVPCVYLLASGFHGTLYTGVSSNLIGRVWQHREEVTKGFTARYGVKRLVWFETHEEMASAIRREKSIAGNVGGRCNSSRPKIRLGGISRRISNLNR
jgi:putative endonuclease